MEHDRQDEPNREISLLHNYRKQEKSTLPTQVLSCSGSKGLSQPENAVSTTTQKGAMLKQIQTPLVRN